MLDYVETERLILEIYTNDLCRELYFLNEQSCSLKFPKVSAWMKNMSYKQCKIHSDALRKKLMNSVLRSFYDMGKYFPEYIESLFKQYYLSNKLSPSGSFLNYCIKFGDYYYQHKMNSDVHHPLNEIMSFCHKRLIMNARCFPDFSIMLPKNWLQYSAILPTYTQVCFFDYDIYSSVEKIKNSEIPIRKKTAYLFSALGEKVEIKTISPLLSDFLSRCLGDQKIDEIFNSMKKPSSGFTKEAHQELVENSVPNLLMNKHILLRE